MNAQELSDVVDSVIKRLELKLWENGRPRSVDDLDSLEFGPANNRGKIYFNTRKDKAEDVEERMDMILSFMSHAENSLHLKHMPRKTEGENNV